MESTCSGQPKWGAMVCYDGLGNLDDGRPFFEGTFTTSSWLTYSRQLLFNYPGDGNWWLGSFDATGKLTWQLVGNTAGFGDLGDGRPIWCANFTGSGGTDVLFYFPGDSNWWLGEFSGTSLNWRLVGNTAGFGNLHDGRPIFIGDFSGSGGTDVLFYSPGDSNWWLGTLDANALTWHLVGNTAGFGLLTDRRPIWTGYFSTTGRPQVLFYSPGDGNWILGTLDGNLQLGWSLAGNTNGFGQLNDGRPIWITDLDQDLRDNVLFHYPGDNNWWLGTFGVDGRLTWRNVGNTSGLGQIWPNCRFFLRPFTRVFGSEVLMYRPADGNWWLGRLTGTQLVWRQVGSTTGFGDISRNPFRLGFFRSTGGFDILFYAPYDGNWWLGSLSGGQLNWTLSANTGRPFPHRIRVHFKVLANPFTPVTDHFNALRDLFAEAGILVEMGTVEDLTAPNPVLDPLRDIDVGGCWDWWVFGGTTGAQNLLFTNRNGVGASDIIVYFVRTIVGGDPAVTVIGCATHPDDQPGCVVRRSAPLHVVAHEIGHVLGLGHAGDQETDRLMLPTISWTNLPPDIIADEARTMRGNGWARQC